MNTFYHTTQNEHESLRRKIDEILNLSNDQSCNYDDIHTKFNEIDTNFQKYKQVTDDAISNLKEQIEYQNTVRVYYFFAF